MVRLMGMNRKKGQRKRLAVLPPSLLSNPNHGSSAAGDDTAASYYQQQHRSSIAAAAGVAVPPMYQYALNEYAQTVAAGTSNDAGKLSEEESGGGFSSSSSSSWSGGVAAAAAAAGAGAAGPNEAPVNHNHRRRMMPPIPTATLSSSSDDSLQAQPPGSPPHGGGKYRRVGSSRTTEVAAPTTGQPTHTKSFLDGAASDYTSASSSKGLPPLFWHPFRSPLESSSDNNTGVPDATYEEVYGDAYTGGPIKYVYPSGYQSMRPRSCPWKLSIVVCVLFTWLSIFIVGHCSDQVEASKYKNDEIDDDTVALQIRWCGSRPLYLMWVTSMLITGLAAAYCSVIGYIKVRDFAVANVRSQPPGVVATGKSDYYLKIDDDGPNGGGGGTGHGDSGGATGRPPIPYGHPNHSDRDGVASTVSNASSSSSDGRSFRPSMYQSDGTPQFWGAHIYRPTQAAVAVTSR